MRFEQYEEIQQKTPVQERAIWSPARAVVDEQRERESHALEDQELREQLQEKAWYLEYVAVYGEHLPALMMALNRHKAPVIWVLVVVYGLTHGLHFIATLSKIAVRFWP